MRPGDLVRVSCQTWLRASLEANVNTSLTHVFEGSVGLTISQRKRGKQMYVFCLFGDRLGWVYKHDLRRIAMAESGMP